MIGNREIDHFLLTLLRAYDSPSDLNLTPGKAPQVEASGSLVPVEVSPPIPVLTPYHTEMLALGILGKERGAVETLVRTGATDCAYEIPGHCRFRVNIFQQKRRYSLVLRKLETKISSLHDLNLPPIFEKIAHEKNGLILVTGATGSGKSTTLAALLNEINETQAVHILTIEDPVEFVHPHKKATFNQRELGTDFDTFASSLKAALRQAPKVILVGEMRDKETIDLGLCAASTGHLVLSTLHSIDCGQTINRIVGMFDKEEEQQIRARLADCLRYVVNQRLLPKQGGGRVACQEIMGMNPRTKDLVMNGESDDKTYYDAIADGVTRGWQTHDQRIEKLYEEGFITEDTAKMYASRRSIVTRSIDRIKQERGIRSDDELDLKMHEEPKKKKKRRKSEDNG